MKTVNLLLALLAALTLIGMAAGKSPAANIAGAAEPASTWYCPSCGYSTTSYGAFPPGRCPRDGNTLFRK